MKKHFFAIFIASLYVSYADTIKFSAMIVDDSTKKPMPNVKVCAGFKPFHRVRQRLQMLKSHMRPF